MYRHPWLRRGFCAVQGERLLLRRGSVFGAVQWERRTWSLRDGGCESDMRLCAQVPEIFWWKHAAGCHQGDVLDGEADVFVEDEVWRAVVGDGDGVDVDVESEGEGESEGGGMEDDGR